MNISLKGLSIWAICISVWATSPAMAQNNKTTNYDRVSVMVVVGDDIVTSTEVKQRLKLALLASSIEPAPEMREKLVHQITQSLINEKLYFQEAERLGIEISQQEIDQGVALIAQKTGNNVEELKVLFKRNNLDMKTLENKVKGEVIWSKILRESIAPTIRVSDVEADELLEQISSTKGDRVYGIEDITLTVDKNTDSQKIAELAESLTDEIKKGASFEALAEQFSSNQAQREEKVLWVQESQLDPKIATKLRALKTGEISEPIRTSEGFVIVKLHGTKDLISVRGEKDEVTMRQLFVALPEESDKRDQYREILESVRPSLASCTSYDEVDVSIIEELHNDEITIQLKDVHPELLSVIEPLEVGEASPVVATTVGLHIVMVCERTVPKKVLPEHKRVKKMVQMKKINLQAKRRLRDLRRNTYIEIR